MKKTMTNLELELDDLKSSILEMMELVHKQLLKSKEAFLDLDDDLAEEIIHNEKRVNAMEIAIDRDCENIFALMNPVATDLRLVISILKINSDLERIGDYAENIAKYVLDIEQPFDENHVKGVQMVEMFDLAILMVNNVKIAFEEESSKLTRKIFKKDHELNEINRSASKIISEFVKEKPDSFRSSLFLFSTIRKLERVGDHVKNIAEDIIFYLEAKVLKHKKQIK